MWYQSDPFQMSVALFIFLNFISQAAEAQLQPEVGSTGEKVLSAALEHALGHSSNCIIVHFM